MKALRSLVSLLLVGSLLWSYGTVLAATGCSYPGSLDSFADKVTNDFLTVANVNTSNCAIEKLESGPLQLNTGTVSLPAYSFQGDANTGIYSAGADQLNITTGGTLAVSVSSGQVVTFANALVHNTQTDNPAANVHGLGANVNVLGNRSATGEFVQRANITAGDTTSADTAIGFVVRTTTFSVAFSTVPVVACSTNSTVNQFIAGCGVRSVSTTQFIAYMVGAASTGNMDLSYIAVGG